MLQFNRKERKPENYDFMRGEGSNLFKKYYRQK